MVDAIKTMWVVTCILAILYGMFIGDLQSQVNRLNHELNDVKTTVEQSKTK